MRIVTVRAIILCGIVDVLCLFDGLGKLLVAPQTELTALGNQQLTVGRRVRIVALAARPILNRAMLVLVFQDFLVIVAIEAQLPLTLGVE
jgi:hypothetical protein